METTETPAQQCKCEIEKMSPERISFDQKFTHRCSTCQGGITYEQNDNYNRFYGFSGYDDDGRDDIDVEATDID